MEVKFTQTCDCDNLHYGAEYGVEGVGAFIIFMFILSIFRFFKMVQALLPCNNNVQNFFDLGLGGGRGAVNFLVQK